jgi:hypothetical protein
MALLVFGECRAEQYDVVKPNTTIAGSIIVKGEKVYLDDGEYEILLLNIDDTSLEDLQAEIVGEYVTVNEKTAFKVTRIDVYEGGELPLKVDIGPDVEK